jgi:hypothetical protein
MGLDVDKDIADVLQENNIAPADVDTIIFSHHHDDHTGDTTKFPSSTRIVVGPGYKKAYLPGWPLDPESIDTTADLYAGREVIEMEFLASDPKVTTIGGFKAYDYFVDGSFYLLSTPGHTVGHLSALARTTCVDGHSTFMFLGGDIVSSNAVIRPSEGIRLPDQVPLMTPGEFCPGEIFAKLHQHYLAGQGKELVRKTPFCAVADSEHDLDESRRNTKKLSLFDDEEDIFLVWAHDLHLKGVVDFFPAMANDWKVKSWKEKAHWRWLDPCSKAVRERKGA